MRNNGVVEGGAPVSADQVNVVRLREEGPPRTVVNGRAATYLVTGVGGGLGGSVARYLAGRGHRVIGLARTTEPAAALRPSGIELRVGDVRDARSLAGALEGVDGVVHLAAIHQRVSPNPSDYLQTNVEGVRHVVEAASRAGVRRFVHVSSIGVHGDTGVQGVDEDAPYAPIDIYGQSKLQGELVARELFASLGLPGVVLRPLGVYGPGDLRFLKLFKGLRKRRFPLVGPCTAVTQLCYVDTFSAAVERGLQVEEAVGRVFIIGDPERPSVEEFVRLAAAAVGGAPLPVRLPLGAMRLVAGATERAFRVLGRSPPIHSRSLEFYTVNRAADVGRMRAVLGVEPTLRLGERLQRTAEWYRQQGLL